MIRTLLYSARDTAHNAALVLHDYLRELTGNEVSAATQAFLINPAR